MNRKSIRFFAFVGFVIMSLLPVSCDGSDVQDNSAGDIAYEAYVAADDGQEWTIADVRSFGFSAPFRPLKAPLENFGGMEKPIWVAVHINDNAGIVFLEIDYAPLQSVEFFLPGNDPGARHISYQRYISGRAVPFQYRPLPTRTHVIPFDSSINRTVYIRVQSALTVIGVHVYSPAGFRNRQSLETVKFTLFYGFIVGMVLYNLFLWVSVRDISYLFYVGFFLALCVHQAVYFGLAYKTFWPDYPIIEDRAYAVATGLTAFFGLCFAYSFLNVRHNVSELSIVFHAAILGAMLIFFLGFIVPRADLLYFLVFEALFSAFLVLAALILALFRGVRSARFFLIASGFSTIAVIIFSTPMFRFIPASFFTRHSMLFGSAIDALMLSLALADRINMLRAANSRALAREQKLSLDLEKLLGFTRKMAATSDAVTAIKTTVEYMAFHVFESEKLHGEIRLALDMGENQNNVTFQFEDSALRILKKATTHLDMNDQRMVELSERSFALERDGELLGVVELGAGVRISPDRRLQLRGVLDTLALTLESIGSVNERRLVIVGEFVLGIAHDIKNDISASYYCLEALESGHWDQGQRVGLIKEVRWSLNEILRKVQDALEYVRGERAPNLATVDLEIFSRILIERFQPIIARRKQVFDIKSKTGGVVRMDRQRITRAVENLVYNASAVLPTAGVIELEIGRDSDDLLLIVRDNGPGMRQGVFPGLFSPFTLIKESHGFGLGLAIVRSIVAEHGGSMEIESRPGSGTEIRMILPGAFIP